MERNTKIILGIVVVAIIVGASGYVLFSPLLTPPSDDTKVVLMLSGSINDFEFNYNWYVAGNLMNSRYDNTTVEVYSDLGTDVSAKEAMREFATEADIIIGATFAYGQFLVDVAPDFPDVIFISPNLSPDNLTNTFAQSATVHKTSYILGMIAANLTQTDKIGYLEGFQRQGTNPGVNGFYQGAIAENPSVNMTPVYAQSFSDPNTARDQAQALIDAGFDILMARVNIAGVITAVLNNPGVLLMGSEADHSVVHPEIIIASQLKHWEIWIDHYIHLEWANAWTNDSSHNNLGLEQHFLFDFEEDGVSINFNPVVYENNTIVSAQLRQRVSDTIDKIKNGTIEVIYNRTQMWP